MLQEVADRTSITEPAERRGRLGPHLVVRVAQCSNQRGESPCGAHLAQYIGRPGSGGLAGGIIENDDQRINDELAVASQNIGDAGCQPALGCGQRTDQWLDRAWVCNPREGTERDLADI